MPRDQQFAALSGNILSSNPFDEQPTVMNSYQSLEYDPPLCCSEMNPFIQNDSSTILSCCNQHFGNVQTTMNYPIHLSPQPSSPSLSPQLLPKNPKKLTTLNKQLPPNINKSYLSMLSAQLDSTFGIQKQKRQKFTMEEDKIIVTLVGDQRFPNWNEIAKHIKGKTGRQCRERYQHYLCPDVSHEPWTKEEDMLILKLYNQHGPNWALISRHFNGKRTNNNIKNRFNNHICSKNQVGINSVYPFAPQNVLIQTQNRESDTTNSTQQFNENESQTINDEVNTDIDYNDNTEIILDEYTDFEGFNFDSFQDDGFESFSYMPFEMNT